jgi:hypothetical protein
MTDVPSRLKAPENRISLAEMAAKAASKSAPPKSVAPLSGRVSSPYPVPGRRSAPPSTTTPRPSRPSARTGDAEGDGSGLIQLDSVRNSSSLAPAVQHLTPPSALARAIPDAPPTRPSQAVARPQGSRFRGGLAGTLIALAGLGTAYGLAVHKGVDPVAAARAYFAPIEPAATPAPSEVSGEDKAVAAPAIADTVAVPNSEMANTNAGAAPGASLHAVDPAANPSDPSQVGATLGSLPDPTDPRALRARPRAGGQMTQRNLGVALATKPAAPPPVAAAAAAGPAAPVSKPGPAAPDPGGLAGAMKKAVGSSDTPPPVAVAAPEAQPMRGDIPEVPPQGAIQGALGGQRSAARACVDAQAGPSRASIVFASTGKVQSVSVTGPAAGTAAEGCIRNALSKANVGPFRRPSFSLSTTITPP